MKWLECSTAYCSNAAGPGQDVCLDCKSKPVPSRLVPHDLLPAARLITKSDNYSGGGRPFTQGEGPLCYGSAEHQSKELARRAVHYTNLAAAFNDLAEWMAAEQEVPNG